MVRLLDLRAWQAGPSVMRLATGLLAAGCALTLSGATLSAAAQEAAPRGLDAVLDTGYILQDRNDDQVVDFVRALFVLPQDPVAAEVVAAANLAARLGYETSATDLDLVVFDGDPGALAAGAGRPLVLVGSRNRLLDPVGLDAAALVAGLAPGQGLMVRVPPGPASPAGGFALLGRDESGLLAVADYASGRLPSVWGLEAQTYADLIEGVEEFLDARDLAPDSTSLERILVDATRLGVGRADLRLVLPDAGQVARAAALLRGEETDSLEPDLASLEIQDLHRIDLRIEVAGGGGPGAIGAAASAAETVRLIPRRPWQTRAGNGAPDRAPQDFSLSAFYSTEGIYRDTNQDLVPDRVDVHLVVADGDAAREVVNLAQRIGLEAAGGRFPLVLVDRGGRPGAGGFPVLIGREPDALEALRSEGLLDGSPPTEPGLGEIRFVPDGFGGRDGILVTGSDAAGVGAATDYAAKRIPYLWTHGKGEYELADAEEVVRRFFQARSPSGEVALALQKLDMWSARIAQGEGVAGNGAGRGEAPAVTRLQVELATQETPEGLDRHTRRFLEERFPGAAIEVSTHPTKFGVGDTVFTQDFEIPWEVDAVRSALRSEVYPRVGSGSSGRIEVRVSESPEVRAGLRAEIREALRGTGADPDDWEVVVLSAYKQGYSWIHDVILPKLRERAVDSIRITYHTLRESEEVRWQTIAAETRWLQELFPVDAVLARELGIPDSVITFHPTRNPDPIYRVRAFEAGGAVLDESFTPKYVVRPFFDLFPEYEQVRVTTGWLRAESGGETLVDRRVATDPETFWDLLQTETYGRIVEYVMEVQDGRPSGANAPYFDELAVELTLSEPDYRIGVDEEVISSLEALHEDIYFETLTLFDLIGQRYGVGGLDYPGRVLPYIQPARDGEAGRARITFTGKERARPELVFTFERGEEPETWRYGLRGLSVPAPTLRGVAVRAGDDEVRRLLFEVEARDSLDRYDEFRERSSEAAIDRTFLSVEMLTGMVERLRELHAGGLFQGEVSLDRVGEVAVRFTLEDDTTGFSRVATVPRSGAPASTGRTRLYAEGYRYRGERLVQWETPIPPAENDSILARMATFPEARVYRVGESFLGQEIFAMDLLPPIEAEYLSQAKLNALRPTLLLSGRQHANEVSSTSHILRLGELLLTDSAYAEHLKRVNVVLHPITNPDGARLAYEMQLVNPDFMLHAGYLGALGVDATSGGGGEDPIYPESRVRPELLATWLPDIYMNLHGYPSHEWVQYFAGYSAWVRSRAGGQRSWWAPRGWFIPGFSWVDDDEYPEIGEAQFAILDSIAAAITSEPEVEAMNRRMYARYRKYGEQDVEGFREYFHNGILVYQSLDGRSAGGVNPGSPRITYFSLTTEAPDETARGEWLELVASAGLAHTSALLRYLSKGEFEIERETEAFEEYVVRSAAREKPVLPKKEEGGEGGSGRRPARPPR